MVRNLLKLNGINLKYYSEFSYCIYSRTDPLRDPNTVGRNDLDPFSPGIGGGMIFDPLNPRNDRSLDPIIPGPSVPRGLPR